MGWLSGIVDGVRSWWSGNRSGSGQVPPAGEAAGIATIEALVERMRALDASLDRDDGVRAFSRMYLRVTELVLERATDGWFTDVRFLTRLDILFAGLYLDVLRAPVPPPAWAPVLELRRAPGRLPIQYALAGMNAHINHDLPLAVVAACRELRVSPTSRGVHEDYLKVNDLLAAVQQEVRQSFLEGLALEVDRAHAGPVANLVGAWSITRARDAAWTNANVLWRLDGHEPLRGDYAATLSRSVGLAGRLLLTPVDELA
ncbi:DUF5995 family protein [Intrasporangium sp. DVR]|uniref:DUF5995 family protein n=1 Tax=Intrasporangium sp. DVR TaxID=3127867 RepID=UPI00313A69E6